MDEQFLQELNNLRKNYRNKMISKVYELEACWHRYMRGSDNKILNSAYHIAHDLSGTAGTYGYYGVGQLCRSLVLYIDQCQEHKDDLCEQIVSHRIETLIILSCLEICTPLTDELDSGEVQTSDWKPDLGRKGHESITSFSVV